MRIGHGYDVHKLVKGRKLILGGVEIKHDLGLLGHSDADVLIHAIMDSLIGAMGLGDIGHFFPDTDEKYKNISSLKLLEYVVDILERENYKVLNIDSTIIAQATKISSINEEKKNNISKICKISAKNINVKATTEEKLGFTGRKEGISAHAVCLISEI